MRAKYQFLSLFQQAHMPRQTYFRPLSLVFGPDARAMIADRDAGALGGSRHIAFTAVEVIERDGKNLKRKIRTFRAVADDPLIGNITRSRSSFAGIDLSLPRIMGVVNVTPDSFSDGGKYSQSDVAIAHGKKLADEGADILDVGGESTRPGSETVREDDELQRVIPVIEGLAASGVVSVDTRKALVMERAARAGARIVNDVSALGFDPDSASTVARNGLPVILMHAQGEPKTMQLAPKYDDVVLDVYDFLAARIVAAKAAHIPEDKICIDPGIGFGKSFEHNLALMQALTIFHGLGVPLLVGVSRKNMIGVLTGEKVPANRVAGSVGGALHAALMGAQILRVHDVAATVHALKVLTVSQDAGLGGF
jgi:dihydropteroate synthase